MVGVLPAKPISLPFSYQEQMDRSLTRLPSLSQPYPPLDALYHFIINEALA